MVILDGKTVAEKILKRLEHEVPMSGVRPGFGAILVGSDPASHIYVSLKRKAAERIGVDFHLLELPETTEESVVLQAINDFNISADIHGILVQLPLPQSLQSMTDKIIGAIDPLKDADGFHSENVRRFLAGDETTIYPVFPHAIIELMRSVEQPLVGKRGAIVCNSDRFGEVMKEALWREGVVADIVLCEKLEESLDIVRNADIVVTACGVPNLISASILKQGAIVIDGGIVKLPDGRVVGDVDIESIVDFEGWLSPVPGGVGPVTVACLLENVVTASMRR